MNRSFRVGCIGSGGGHHEGVLRRWRRGAEGWADSSQPGGSGAAVVGTVQVQVRTGVPARRVAAAGSAGPARSRILRRVGGAASLPGASSERRFSSSVPATDRGRIRSAHSPARFAPLRRAGRGALRPLSIVRFGSGQARCWRLVLRPPRPWTSIQPVALGDPCSVWMRRGGVVLSAAGMRVVVVGAGIGGLAVALRLGRFGDGFR
jgi:hypothetical protein